MFTSKYSTDHVPKKINDSTSSLSRMIKRLRKPWFLTSTLVAVSLISLFTLYITLSKPWLGIQIAKSERDSYSGLEVRKVHANGPAHGLIEQGDRIVSLIAAGKSYPLPDNIRADPNLVPTFDQFNELIDLQRHLNLEAKKGSVTFQLASGEQVSIAPESSRPLQSLGYWVFVNQLAAVLCAVMGAYLFIHAKPSITTALLLLLGFSIFAFLTASTLSDRELIGGPEHTKVVAQARNFFGHFYPSLLTAVFFSWPTKILSYRWSIALTVATPVILLLVIFQFIALPFHQNMMLVFAFALLLVLMFIAQWKRSNQAPVERAALKIMLLAIMAPVVFIVTFGNLPLLLQQDPILDFDLMNTLICTSIMLGWLVAVFQLRLFDVERWWFSFFFWYLGGIAVILLDLVLAYFLHITVLSSLPLALVIAGFLYFPVRQGIARKYLSLQNGISETVLAGFVSNMTNARSLQDFDRRWEEILRRMFRPAAISRLDSGDPVPASALRLNNAGLILQVPGTDKLPTLELKGKNNNTQLFNSQDLTLIDSLVKIRDVSHSAQTVREAAIFDERERIMSDLHDSLGAKLLSLIHESREDRSASLARSSLETLRETVRYSTTRGDILLSELFADLKSECMDRTAVQSVALLWEQQAACTNLAVNSLHALCLSNTIRECVSNALKHSNSAFIRIAIECDNTQLVLQIENTMSIAQKEVSTTSHQSYGSGLKGLEKRLTALSGHIEVDKCKQSSRGEVFSVEVSLPLESPAT